MSLVYAFECNGCGKLSHALPGPWITVGSRHYCEEAQCRIMASNAEHMLKRFVPEGAKGER